MEVRNQTSSMKDFFRKITKRNCVRPPSILTANKKMGRKLCIPEHYKGISSKNQKKKLNWTQFCIKRLENFEERIHPGPYIILSDFR